MIYKIIKTGSKGNAVLINNIILIDCGVSFKMLNECYKNLELILLTHIHSDHLNFATIKRLAFEHPSIRFVCFEWMIPALISCNIRKENIDLIEENKKYIYSLNEDKIILEGIKTIHDVPNCAYKLKINNEQLFYATDLNTLNGIEAKGYDVYMVEANYKEKELVERTKDKIETGQYIYEFRAAKNHLSYEKAIEWLGKNMSINSDYILLHQHREWLNE